MRARHECYPFDLYRPVHVAPQKGVRMTNLTNSSDQFKADAKPDFDQLIAIGRQRALNDDETTRLVSLARWERKREVWRWSEKEDRQLKALIKRRASVICKPFTRNDEIRLIAQAMGRSYIAVHKRIERLRKAMK